MISKFWQTLHYLATPVGCYRLCTAILLPAFILAWLCIAVGLVGGFIIAPADYQQKDAFRIIYLHVPAAWLSLSIYTQMACAAIIWYIWRIKVIFSFLQAAAPIGAVFTVITLVTGSLWGKPMWGAYWVWDARLTSELILLLLYLGYMLLSSHQAGARQSNGAKNASALLLIIGLINIPIIHYSVVWWNSLHQTSSISFINASASISWSMLWPLLIMLIGANLLYLWLVALRWASLLLANYANNTPLQTHLAKKYNV